MQSKLDFSLVANFVDKVTAPMGAVANQTDSAMAKLVDYDAALRSIGQQKGLVKSLEQQSQGLKAPYLSLAARSARLTKPKPSKPKLSKHSPQGSENSTKRLPAITAQPWRN